MSNQKEIKTELTKAPPMWDQGGRRLFQIPLEVKGKFRNQRNIVYTVLILFFLILPWIKINGTQALLLDIQNRHFSIFGLQFWSHDAPMLFFVFGTIAFSIFLVTAVWGRVWCGWACPQTVFIDGVYRKIEILVEGPAPKRKALAMSPWNKDKIIKYSIKWSLWIGVTLIITHSFLAYFVGTEKLLEMIQRSPSESPTSFLFILASTGLSLFNFTWFREQFCVIVCPYGRFQAALMDEHSKTVAYDKNRPDCIDCKRCHNVCPTGIDIRNGVQMECIGCTACIDACDEIMDKVKKPRGLIRYSSEIELNGGVRQNIRPRSILYMCILCILVGGLSYLLLTRENFKITLIKQFEMPTNVETDPLRLYHYTIEINNQGFKPQDVKFSLRSDKETEIPAELAVPQNPLNIEKGKTKKIDVFVKMKRENTSVPVYLILESPEKNALFEIYKPAITQ